MVATARGIGAQSTAQCPLLTEIAILCREGRTLAREARCSDVEDDRARKGTASDRTGCRGGGGLSLRAGPRPSPVRCATFAGAHSLSTRPPRRSPRSAEPSGQAPPPVAASIDAPDG